jgi:hypothetical protein
MSSLVFTSQSICILLGDTPLLLMQVNYLNYKIICYYKAQNNSTEKLIIFDFFIN